MDKFFEKYKTTVHYDPDTNQFLRESSKDLVFLYCYFIQGEDTIFTIHFYIFHVNYFRIEYDSKFREYSTSLTDNCYDSPDSIGYGKGTLFIESVNSYLNNYEGDFEYKLGVVIGEVIDRFGGLLNKPLAITGSKSANKSNKKRAVSAYQLTSTR